jgi:queuine tRNA-ribosyltransferase
MLKFDIEKQSGLMRAGVIHTPHGDIKTPAFVGAATRASVKAITHAQMRELGSQAILANTYHLILAPGPELIEQAGGLAEFTSWHGPSFTDSGGFQMLSLKDAKIDHDGVTFKSHINGDKIRMTAEISMQAQWQIGADIHMAFDQAIDSKDKNEVEKAMRRTHDWLPRNIAEHNRLAALAKADNKPEQYLYAVVQGGLFEDLRRESAEFMSTQPVDGYGIGSLYTTETPETANMIKLTN